MSPPLLAQAQALYQTGRLHEVRVAWADIHGSFRGKTLVLGADASEPLRPLRQALEAGVGMVGTVMLKDTSDRTAVPVFEAQGPGLAPALHGASNVLLWPDASSWCVLPWAPGTGWLRAQPSLAGAGPDQPMDLDPRAALQRAVAALAAYEGQGYTLRCGLEVELHITRIARDELNPDEMAWPAEPPPMHLLHPGYNLLNENWADRCHEPLTLLRQTALGLGLPLRSLEIELGPSQFEAVFDATHALTAADQLSLFRNAARQALRRAGYHVSFVCRPPWPEAIASGWHLHHSVVDAAGGNAFMLPARASERGSKQPVQSAKALPSPGKDQAGHWLSDVGQHWLAGLLAHAPALAALCAPSINAYSRYQGGVMAPQAAHWGADNRGAMLRVLGGAGDTATRIENRLGEPMANPYLVMAAHIWTGLDGLKRRLKPGAASTQPYATSVAAKGQAPLLPQAMPEALQALAQDACLQQGLGPALCELWNTIKQQEFKRYSQAQDKALWLRREYFARF